jgi:hypothetical protein
VDLKVKPFSFFTETMKPQLERVAEDQRNALIEELWDCAKWKADLEWFQSIAPEGVSDLRKGTEQFRRMHIHLAKARKEIEKARASLDRDNVDYISPDFDFTEPLREIGLGLETATNMQKLHAAMIHPDLRTDAEKALVRPRDEVEPYTYPAPDAYSVDYAFIERANRALKRYRGPNRRRLSDADRHRIIAKLFYAAFKGVDYDRVYTPERIKRALNLMRKHPRTRYRPEIRDTPATRGA